MPIFLSQSFYMQIVVIEIATPVPKPFLLASTSTAISLLLDMASSYCALDVSVLTQVRHKQIQTHK
jgi:hypothetical protein